MQRCSFVLALSLLVLPARARAETEAVETTAKIHYEAGVKFYDAHAWREALREFATAYEFSPRAGLLYNMARCDEQLGDFTKAAAAYEQFLAQEPSSAQRAEIEERLTQIRAQMTTETTTPPSEPPRRLRKYPFILGGVGLALLAASIGTGVVALQREHSLSQMCGGDVCSPTDSAELSLRNDGVKLAHATDALLGVGGAVFAAGVVTLSIEVVRWRHAKPGAR